MHDQSTRELRTRQADYVDAADRLVGPSPASAASMVVVTVAVATYPTAVGVYYGCQQLDPDGVEVEGGAAGFTTVPGTFYVAVTDGSAVPAVGTKLVVDSVGGRWVVRA